NNCQDFRGGSATAVMGRCEIDLRAAAITTPHEPVLEVFAMWGGIEVRVPPDWTVVSQVDPILGGYDDSTQPPKHDSNRLLIRGSSIMGGSELTNYRASHIGQSNSDSFVRHCLAADRRSLDASPHAWRHDPLERSGSDRCSDVSALFIHLPVVLVF